MEQAGRREARRSGMAEADDPFRYGWRYVRRTQPDGTVVIEDDRPWFYDAVTGVREPDCPEWRQTLAEARERAQDAEVRAQDATTRATRAEARAQAEAQARMALEARVRALEEQLQRQTGADAHSPSVEPQAEEPS
jgi:hypothetical protein